jgi:predicted aspartyl protease
MKNLVHHGRQFPIDEGDVPLNYIVVEMVAPNGIEFIRVKALIDTGSSTTVITSALVERLGADDVLPYLGDQIADTANGVVKEPTTEINLRVTGSDGNCTLFQDWPVVISKTMEEPIFGMDLLQYYATQIRHGQVVSLIFDESSPAGLQKRKVT